MGRPSDASDTATHKIKVNRRWLSARVIRFVHKNACFVCALAGLLIVASPEEPTWVVIVASTGLWLLFHLVFREREDPSETITSEASARELLIAKILGFLIASMLFLGLFAFVYSGIFGIFRGINPG